MRLPNLRVGNGRNEEDEPSRRGTSRRKRGSRGSNILQRSNSSKGNGRGSRGSNKFSSASRSAHDPKDDTEDCAEPGHAESDTEEKVKSRLQNIFARNVPISTSLHGDNKRRSKDSLFALHDKVSEAKSTLSTSLHGLRGSYGSGGGANLNALKTELANMRTILLAYKDENDELLQDLNIVLDENDFLNQELVKICDENENLVEDKQDLKEQLEEAQFEQEEAMLKYKDHMAVCQLKVGANTQNKRGSGRAAAGRNRRGSLMGNMADIRRAAAQSFPINNHQPNANKDGGEGINRAGNEGQSSGSLQLLEQKDATRENVHDDSSTPLSSRKDDEMSKLALSSLQAEMARKTRAWEEERTRMQEQMQKYQDEMEQLRDAAQLYATQQKKQTRELKCVRKIMDQCESCRTSRETELEQERKAAQELQDFLASRTKGFVKTPSTASQCDNSLGSQMKTDQSTPARQSSGRRGVGRMSFALQDRFDRALQIAITGQEQNTGDCRSRSVCSAADGIVDGGNSNLLSEKKGGSLALNNADARRNRRKSLCVGPDSELAKGLARLRNKHPNNDQSSTFADSVDLDEVSSVLPSSSIEPNVFEALNDFHASQESCTEPSIDKTDFSPVADTEVARKSGTSPPIICRESESHLAANGKAYLTSQWKLAQSADLGHQDRDSFNDYSCHSAALPPIRLSLTERYYTETLDEESWVTGGDRSLDDGADSTQLPSNSNIVSESGCLSHNIQQAVALAEKIAADRNMPIMKAKGNGSSEEMGNGAVLGLTVCEEDKKKEQEMNGDSSTFSGTRSATDESDAESHGREIERCVSSSREAARSLRLGTLGQVNKLLGQERRAKCLPQSECLHDERGGIASVNEANFNIHGCKAAIDNDNLFVEFPSAKNRVDNNIAKRKFRGLHRPAKVASRAPSA